MSEGTPQGLTLIDAAPRPRGRCVIHADRFSAPGEFEPQDLILVDFDRRTIAHDGVFLFEWHRPGHLPVPMARRFELPFRVGTPLRSLEPDGWVGLPPDFTASIRVLGYVERVYVSVPRHMERSVLAEFLEGWPAQ